MKNDKTLEKVRKIFENDRFATENVAEIVNTEKGKLAKCRLT